MRDVKFPGVEGRPLSLRHSSAAVESPKILRTRHHTGPRDGQGERFFLLRNGKQDFKK